MFGVCGSSFLLRITIHKQSGPPPTTAQLMSAADKPQRDGACDTLASAIVRLLLAGGGSGRLGNFDNIADCPICAVVGVSSSSYSLVARDGRTSVGPGTHSSDSDVGQRDVMLGRCSRRIRPGRDGASQGGLWGRGSPAQEG